MLLVGLHYGWHTCTYFACHYHCYYHCGHCYIIECIDVVADGRGGAELPGGI